MNRYTFSTQSGKAYYCNSIPGFICDRSTDIVGRLVRHAFDINKEQANAWENQISELQRRLEECGMEGDIIFEYDEKGRVVKNEIIQNEKSVQNIEIKYDGEDIYLIEANLRGGGDDISNKLVQMSSGFDYLRCMIEVALGIFNAPQRVSDPAYAGIYYLCKQTEKYLSFFQNADKNDWFVEGVIKNQVLSESHSNYERDGYVIYKSNRKIILQEQK